MLFTSSLLFFACTWLLSECITEDVYALANKEAKLYFDYKLNWEKASIQNDSETLAQIEKTTSDVKLKIAGKDGINVKYIQETNQGLVTIRNVSSGYNGTIKMTNYSGSLLKQWQVHVLERTPAKPFIKELKPPSVGQDYQLSCNGDSFGVSRYKWYKEGQILTSGIEYNITGNNLMIRNVQRGYRAKLTCIQSITDDIQSSNSDIFDVDVQCYGPDNIKITSEPPDFTVEVSNSITLMCNATCHPSCHFQWHGLVNATKSSLKVQYMTYNQNGPYTCTATNPKCGTQNKSQPVFLNSRKKFTETFKMTETSKDTKHEEDGVPGQSSDGTSRDSNMIALFYMILVVIISCFMSIVFE